MLLWVDHDQPEGSGNRPGADHIAPVTSHIRCAPLPSTCISPRFRPNLLVSLLNLAQLLILVAVRQIRLHCQISTLHRCVFTLHISKFILLSQFHQRTYLELLNFFKQLWICVLWAGSLSHVNNRSFLFIDNALVDLIQSLFVIIPKERNYHILGFIKYQVGLQFQRIIRHIVSLVSVSVHQTLEILFPLSLHSYTSNKTTKSSAFLIISSQLLSVLCSILEEWDYS